MKRTERNNQSNAEPNQSSRFQSFLYYFDIFYRVVKALVIIIVIVLVIGGALGAGTAIGYFASLVHGTEVPEYEQMVSQVTDYNSKSTMYYGSGEIISDLRADLLRTPIDYEEVSPLLVNAIVATEDEHFFEHEGVVPKAVARALVQDIVDSGASTGGSTLTQQLVKQQMVGAEVSHARKANEILLAMRLENHMDKDEILQAYLNVSPFGRNNKGQNIAGVEEAAQGIFGVPASEVSLPQAAFIAGLPQRPIAFSPYTQTGQIKEDQSLGLRRQREVLFRMYREGYISREEYDEALEYDLTQDFINREEIEEDGLSYIYDLAETEAVQLLIQHYYEEDGITQEMLDNDPSLSTEYYERAYFNIRNKGYQIHTTIDRDIHYALENTVAQYRDELGIEQTITYTDDEGVTHTETLPVQIGGALIDNETGRVIAFIGGRDYEVSQFNNAFQMRRSPGSIIKPLLVYGPALAEGLITPATIIPDTEYAVPNWNAELGEFEDFFPSNYGDTTNEWMTAREALYRSQNIPAYRLYMEMKDDYNPGEYIRRMGMGPQAIKDKEFENAALSIGGTDAGPTPVELVSAFASMGNNGVHVEPYVIDRIEDSQGEIVYQNESAKTEVWSPDANYMLLDMLRDVHTEGTARGVMDQVNFDADWISKTGTTQSYSDVWYVASTPRVSFGTWIGYGTSRANLRHDYGIHPSLRVRTMWARLVNAVYEQNPDIFGVGELFPRPEGITEESVIQATGMKAGTVEAPDGSTFSYSGPTHTEIFASGNVPGPTVYDFAIQASEEDYQNFWSRYLDSLSPDTNESDDNSNDESDEEETNEPSTSPDSSNDSNGSNESNDNGNDESDDPEPSDNSNGNGSSNEGDANGNNDDPDTDAEDDSEDGNGNGNGNGNGEDEDG